MPAFSEISGEWKATSSSRKDSPTTPTMNTGMRPFMYSLWSSSAAVTPPTCGRDAGVAELLGNRVVTQPVDEIRGLLVLGRALRDDGDDRRVTGAVERRVRDERDAGSPRRLRANRSTAGLASGPGMSAAMTIGPLVPAPKPSVFRS